MSPRALLVQMLVQGALLSLVSSFVLMEADNTDIEESEIEQRILYLVKILQRVKQLTDEDLSQRQLDDQDLSARRLDDQDFGSRRLEDPDLGYVSSSGLIDPRLLSERLLNTEQEAVNDQKSAYIQLKNSDLSKLAKKLKQSQWPIDKSYERVIDIQKKDFAILPPSSEWCRMMGFRRCRNGATS